MKAHPLALVRYRAFDQNGQPLIGGQVFAYEAGSTTSPKDTYSDRSMGTLNQWPVILDDVGSAPIYISGDYFFQVFDADGNLIEEGDGIADAESIAQALIEGTSSSAAIIEQRVTDLETARDEHTDQINEIIDDVATLRTDLDKEVNTDRNAAINSAVTTANTALDTALRAEINDQIADVTTLINNNTAAINAVIQVTAGSIFLWASQTVPTGYLELAGQAISRTTYSALFAILGTTFGTGDGSTTFNLPDMRGEFVRGWDHTRGIDSGRAFGSAQEASSVFMGDTTATDGKNVNLYNNHDDNAQTLRDALKGEATTIDATHVVVVSSSATATDPVTATTTTMSVRPRNIALMYIIKT